MELRRALLLFAIVLGLAAIVTSVSNPRDGDDGKTDTTATTPEAAGDPVAVLRFSAQGEPLVERLDAGRPATVLVAVDQPGQVELEGLGLSAAAEPSTPAHFDVLSERIGSHAVRFTKAGTAETRTVGTLRIVAVGES